MAASNGHARVLEGSQPRRFEWKEMILLVAAAIGALAVIPSLVYLYPVGVIFALSATSAAMLVLLLSRQRGRPQSAPLGTEYPVTLERVSGGERTIRVLATEPMALSESRQVDWAAFGSGIERLKDQIRGYDGRIDVDACIGINDAGLVMATFLSSAVFGSPFLGYVRYHRAGPGAPICIDRETTLPDLEPAEPTLLLADFELKSGNALRAIVELLRQTYSDPRIYLAAFGARTDRRGAEIEQLKDLTAQGALASLGVELFVACTMGDPGIEPPLMLK